MTNRRSGLHGAIGQSVTVLALVVAMADGVDAQSALELSLGRIGVRPFVNITGLDDDAWFGVGFAESIAVGLSGVTVLEGTGGTDLHSVIRVEEGGESDRAVGQRLGCLLYTSPSPRD